MRIYDYPLKTTILGTEKLLGSYDGETKNFTIDSLSNFVIDKINTTPTSGVFTSADKVEIFNFINAPRCLNLITSATSTTLQNKNDLQSFTTEVNYVYLYCDSPDSGTYTATINFYTTDDGTTLKLIASDELSESKTISSIQLFLNNKSFCATLTITGVVPPSGVNVRVMV